MKRENWATRFGIILAVAGSAVGLGNFLRFPGLVAQNGGGAFMIPYFLAFVFLGLPICWVEWTMGRFGGRFGHSSAPGTFDAVTGGKPWAKYLGVLGIIGPLGIFFYYVYIEAWTLSYACFSIIGKYSDISDPQAMQQFFGNFLGGEGTHFHGMGLTYLFFLITIIVNFWVIYHGLTRGIERFCEFAMPLLFLAGVALMIRVLTLGSPLPDHPDWNVQAGLGFIWNPDFSALKSGNVWLKASGQIFFTLSVGIGVILTYSSYVKSRQDIALSSLTASSMNEFAEVVVGSSVVIVAAVCFFGPIGAMQAAEGGIFGLGFVTMPMVFNRIPGGEMFGFYWFALLFTAGVTSSISLLQPTVSFLEEEFGIRRLKAVLIIGALSFAVAHLAIFGNGVIDELDFWFSSLGLPLFGMIEILLFIFVFGVDRGWKELHKGAEIRISPVFKFVVKYITPVYLGAVLIFWLLTDGWQTIIMKKLTEDGQLTDMYSAEQIPWVWTTRIFCLALLGTAALVVRAAWKRKRLTREEGRLR